MDRDKHSSECMCIVFHVPPPLVVAQLTLSSPNIVLGVFLWRILVYHLADVQQGIVFKRSFGPVYTFD